MRKSGNTAHLLSHAWLQGWNTELGLTILSSWSRTSIIIYGSLLAGCRLFARLAFSHWRITWRTSTSTHLPSLESVGRCLDSGNVSQASFLVRVSEEIYNTWQFNKLHLKNTLLACVYFQIALKPTSVCVSLSHHHRDCHEKALFGVVAIAIWPICRV